MPMESKKKTLKIENIWSVLRTIHRNDPEQAEKLASLDKELKLI